MCVYTGMCSGSYAHACAHIWRSEKNFRCCSSDTVCHIFCDSVSLSTWSSPMLLGWLACGSWRSVHLQLLSAGDTSMRHHTQHWFYMSSGDTTQVPMLARPAPYQPNQLPAWNSSFHGQPCGAKGRRRKRTRLCF